MDGDRRGISHSADCPGWPRRHRAICPLHRSLHCFQQEDDRTDAIRASRHTNGIVFEPGTGGLEQLSFCQLPHHRRHRLPSYATHPLRRVNAVAVQHLPFAVPGARPRFGMAYWSASSRSYSFRRTVILICLCIQGLFLNFEF